MDDPNDDRSHLDDPTRQVCIVPASEASVAAGLSRYALPRSLWEVKVGAIVPSVFETHSFSVIAKEDNEATLHGVRTEHPVRLHVADLLGCGKIKTCSFRTHPSPEWSSYFGSTPDGFIELDPLTNQSALVEIKCPLQVLEWEFVPPEYMAQIQMQLEVMQVNVVYFAAYFKKLEKIKVWRVYRSKPYWGWLSRRLLTFVKCVEDVRMPSAEDIPIVYFEAQHLAKTDYDFTTLQTKLQRRDLPPKVFTELLFNEKCTAEDLARFERRSLLARQERAERARIELAELARQRARAASTWIKRPDGFILVLFGLLFAAVMMALSHKQLSKVSNS